MGLLVCFIGVVGQFLENDIVCMLYGSIGDVVLILEIQCSFEKIYGKLDYVVLWDIFLFYRFEFFLEQFGRFWSFLKGVLRSFRGRILCGYCLVWECV